MKKLIISILFLVTNSAFAQDCIFALGTSEYRSEPSAVILSEDKILKEVKAMGCKFSRDVNKATLLINFNRFDIRELETSEFFPCRKKKVGVKVWVSSKATGHILSKSTKTDVVTFNCQVGEQNIFSRLEKANGKAVKQAVKLAIKRPNLSYDEVIVD